MELFFVTTNSGKVRTVQECLKKMGLPVMVKQHTMKLTEIQANDAEEISRAKAREAFAELKAPLIVEDSGFHINALNGFPGVYARYLLDTIGSEGIIKMMEGVPDRSCKFIAVTTFIDGSGKLISFRDAEGKGVIAKKKDETHNPLAWSDLWRIYIPEGLNKTLSALTEEESNKHYNGAGKKKGSLFLFAEWLSKNLDCLEYNK
ncbi:non-canonical purine NTP pyrophosphatase [Pseudomonadota bacterium]